MTTTDLGSEAGPDTERPPVDIEVVRGNPSPEELAAIVAVISDMVAQADSSPRVTSASSRWDRSEQILRAPLHPGPHAWSGFSG